MEVRLRKQEKRDKVEKSKQNDLFYKSKDINLI